MSFKQQRNNKDTQMENWEQMKSFSYNYLYFDTIPTVLLRNLLNNITEAKENHLLNPGEPRNRHKK